MPAATSKISSRGPRDPEASFLGRGWSFPVSLDEAGDAALAEREEDVRQAIVIILGTAPGERVMRPDFGAGLDELVFEPMSVTTFELVKFRVEEALTRWEPRITLREVDVARGAPNTGQLLIAIRYSIRDSNTESNLVYPFYLIEGGRR